MPGLNLAARNAELVTLGTLISAVSLHSTDPGNGAAAGSAEPSGFNYSRRILTWVTPTAAELASAADVIFEVPAGTYTHMGFWSQATGGTFYGSRALDEPAVFATPGTLTIRAGQIVERLL